MFIICRSNEMEFAGSWAILDQRSFGARCTEYAGSIAESRDEK